VNIESLTIAIPKGPWLSAETRAAIEAHNREVAALAVDLDALATDLDEYRRLDFSVADLDALAAARGRMMNKVLAAHQRTVALARARDAVATRIIAEADDELARAQARLAERREATRAALASAGVVGGDDAEANRLAHEVAALRGVGPWLRQPATMGAVSRIEARCRAALQEAMVSGLPTLDSED